MYGNKAQGIFLDVRKDGIYLLLNNNSIRDPAITKNPLKLLEDTGIKDVNAEALVLAFQDKNERVEVKISSDTTCNIKNETLTVEVSKDAMEAKIRFNEPHWLGVRMTAECIFDELKANGVVYGVLTEMVWKLQTNKLYGEAYTVAVGKQAIPGKDGSLKFHFDVNNRGNKPRLLEDGRVDYKDTNYILKVCKDDLLAEIIEPGSGVNGANVRGQIVPHRPGKQPPRLPKGKNTRVSEDGLKLYADAAGQIIIESGRINIILALDIPGDVGNETGNIDFIGAVSIAGNVTTGFTVKATGDISVRGAVEASVIEAGGNVNLLGGIKGIGKGIVKAGGDIFVLYAERATLIAEGDVSGDSIMHSTVKCKGHLNVGGKKGLLVGGYICAGKSVTAKTIGSRMATATEVIVGSSPEHLDRYNELEKLYNQAKAEYENEKLIDNFKQGNEDLRLRSLHARIHIRVNMDKIQKEMNELLTFIGSTGGVIRASQTVHSGCKIIVGGVMMRAQDDLIACSLRNVDGKVNIGAY